ncbi:FAD-dependent oxidoreductase [uncultured Roseobacter sp.]|uniref:flavin monoamine oxidase family protein n=1 Tax=uncultured Roseobacter sp. TaxID=114847 RepID=UPI002613A256|nr:FAD-dependent oxidoreductase [uncultured Roseobacter sp.]
MPRPQNSDGISGASNDVGGKRVKTDVLIIGGGLAGLSLADRLGAAGRDFQIVEARNRFGGRIKTESFGGARYDMGPAWYWPGQPRMAALVKRLRLTPFDQFCTGLLIAEDEAGRIQRARGHAPMQGSIRVQGGMRALTDALADAIPEQRKTLGVSVTGLSKKMDGATADLSNGFTITARQVVLALPPRLAANTIRFSPALDPTVARAMQAIPTWMAGQAKALVIYDSAFWRDAGFSVDAMSRRGPMVEIHDASPAEDGPFALFGFIGLPVDARHDEAKLREGVVSQLERLFGSEARKPRVVYIKDWAQDHRTATQQDHAPLFAHPAYGLPDAMKHLWANTLVLGGTEVAPYFGGFLEGALEAAENAFNDLNT